MLEIRRMRLLLELQRRGTIASVAEALHYSPSGISQQLILLENELGVPLLERVGRGVRLTEPARVLAEYADRVITELERAESEALAASGSIRGTVRVASFQTAGLTLVPRMLELLSTETDLRIELTQAEPERSMPALLAREYDLMIGEEYPGVTETISNDVHRVDLCNDALELAFPADSSEGADDVSISDGANFPWILEPIGSMSRVWATNFCRSHGFEPDVQFETEDMVLHRELVRRGKAAAFVPEILLNEFAGGPDTISIGQSRTIFTAVRQGSQEHPAIITVRQALAEAAQQS